MNAPLTVLAPDPVKTDVSSETYMVSNGDFLLTVFGKAIADALAEARPVMVSFNGNPAKAPGRVWAGKPWMGEADLATTLPPNANNYFSLAVFRPDEAGQFRRQKAPSASWPARFIAWWTLPNGSWRSRAATTIELLQDRIQTTGHRSVPWCAQRSWPSASWPAG